MKQTPKEQTESVARLWCAINHVDYDDHSVDADGVIHVKATATKPIEFITIECEVSI